MSTKPQSSDVVAGVFADHETADRAVQVMADSGLSRDAIGVLATNADVDPDASTRRGLVTGAVLGALGGIVLEATVLAFPPAAIFVAGGTLAAALAGLTVGTGAGAIAGALLDMGFTGRTASGIESTLRSRAGRVLVTFSSSEARLRDRARQAMRVQGAIETHDAADAEEQGPVFAPGFVSVVPQLRAHLREREGTEEAWSKHEPRYRYGWQMANRPDFRERAWREASADIQSDWERRHPDVSWGEAAPFVERGWTAARAGAPRVTVGSSRGR
jgi:hypothetical protein